MRCVLSAVLFLGALGDFCSFKDIYPKQYVAYKTSTPLVVDGRLDDPGWQEVPFTDLFVDISTTVVPRFQTQAKIRWDEKFLYVGARMQEPQIWANLTQHDSVIYYDNDFEVFVSPDGSNHYYKEFEMNALNTTWDLALNKPYLNGGYENSSRVFGPHGFEMQPPLYCRAFVNGKINDPASYPNVGWEVEIALPLEFLALNNTVTGHPKPGDFWRINFSRVEWHVLVWNGIYVKQPMTPEDNWVWSPQGVINMHVPERWGILQFEAGRPGHVEPKYYPQWPVRSVAMYLYDAELAYFQKNGKYTADVAALQDFAPPHTIDGTCTQLPQVVLNGPGYLGTVRTKGDDMTATIRDDRLLLVRES